MRPEEPVFVEHPLQDAAQLSLIDQSKEPPTVDPRRPRVGDAAEQVGVAGEVRAQLRGDVREAGKHRLGHDDGGAQREQADQ